MSKHTPGPWTRFGDQPVNRGCTLNGDPYYRQMIVRETEDGDTCHVVAGDMAEADAKLIAAAPELLESVQRMLSVARGYKCPFGIALYPFNSKPADCDCNYHDDIRFARAAIAKAEGR